MSYASRWGNSLGASYIFCFPDQFYKTAVIVCIFEKDVIFANERIIWQHSNVKR